ncbi:MAG: hypothetical protein IJ617_09415 [Oscillospiraceae bacterium]|nr:hypothetical protein [Oscillospiraceae bacterium]
MDTKERIYGFFVQKKRADGLAYDTELLRSRHINSLFALEIVRFVEKEFSIKIPRKEISEANFHSIDAMAALVERLRGA